MTADQPHRCTLQTRNDGTPYLAFRPASGEISSYSSSLFTLDLRPDVTAQQAQDLADHINRQLWGVSTTIF